jgi:hypothetical protein
MRRFRIMYEIRGLTGFSDRLRQFHPNWQPANLDCAPIWFQTKLSLVFIFQEAKMERTKR